MKKYLLLTIMATIYAFSNSAYSITIDNALDTNLTVWVYKKPRIYWSTRDKATRYIVGPGRTDLDLTSFGEGFGIVFAEGSKIINSVNGYEKVNTKFLQEGLFKNVKNDASFSIWKGAASGLYVQKRN